jgi:hypothetical protein
MDAMEALEALRQERLRTWIDGAQIELCGEKSGIFEQLLSSKNASL